MMSGCKKIICKNGSVFWKTFWNHPQILKELTWFWREKWSNSKRNSQPKKNLTGLVKKTNWKALKLLCMTQCWANTIPAFCCYFMTQQTKLLFATLFPPTCSIHYNSKTSWDEMQPSGGWISSWPFSIVRCCSFFFDRSLIFCGWDLFHPLGVFDLKNGSSICVHSSNLKIFSLFFLTFFFQVQTEKCPQ